MNNTTLGARVGQLNPKWNEDSSVTVLDTQFLKAVALTGREFQVCVRGVNGWCRGG